MGLFNYMAKFDSMGIVLNTDKVYMNSQGMW